MENNKHKKHIPFASKTQLAMCVMLCPICIALYAIINEYTKLDAVFLALIFSFVYLIGVALIATYHKQFLDRLSTPVLEDILEEEGALVFRNSSSPIVIADSYGTILWYNDAMHKITDDKGNFIGSNISSWISKPLTKQNLAEGEPIAVYDNLYRVEGFEISTKGNGLYMAILEDVTSFTEIKKRYDDERVAVAYIAIDNIEDIVQYVHEKFNDALSRVEDTIKEWAQSMGGVVKAYDDDKYIVLFDSSKLDECIRNRFEILDNIRNARIGDGISITASIGVSKAVGSLADREKAAREAIDLALQRGGDQVVYKTENGIEYYGGRTKSTFKKSSIHSRTFVSQLSALIARSDNVIVMGHKYGDFDSFGASVGAAKIAMHLGIKVNIAVDMRDLNLQPCIDLLSEHDSYSHVFVDSAEAFDLITPDTLIILVDHNNFDRSQFSEIAKRSGNVVIIDHHRKIDVMPDSVKLHYIEPSASSTCELLAEMLEFSIATGNILKTEADVLLAGILLDTKQFTRNTGTRTFGAAQYLRGVGANPSDVYDMFKTAVDDLEKEAKFHTNITLYRENIAISSCEEDTDDSYRIIASKAADKMLTLKNVKAAFSLVKIGEFIHISGRSNGKVNVQIILEKLHGGGHYDIAGAQVKSDSIISVLDTLKASIDDFLDQKESDNKVN